MLIHSSICFTAQSYIDSGMSLVSENNHGHEENPMDLRLESSGDRMQTSSTSPPPEAGKLETSSLCINPESSSPSRERDSGTVLCNALANLTSLHTILTQDDLLQMKVLLRYLDKTNNGALLYNVNEVSRTRMVL